MDRRIAGYDLARSLALFWLVVVNFGVGVENADLEKADHGLFQWQIHHLIPVGATTVFLVLGGNWCVPPEATRPNNKRYT